MELEAELNSLKAKDTSIKIKEEKTNKEIKENKDRESKYGRDVLEQQNKIWNDIVVQQQRATLPKQHVPKFNGNPLEYCSFVRAFDMLIASKEPDFSCKLYYLEQYTIGRPQELVKSCLHMEPAAGYKKARELPELRFGDKYKIAMPT